MEIKEFVENTIYKLEEEDFIKLKKRLVGEYISFSFIDSKGISTPIVRIKL